MDRLLTIGQAAEAAGLTPTTLRHYDQIDLVPPTTRRSGQRRYTDRDVRRLRVVNYCRQAGFTLSEIATLLDGDDGWQPLARRKRDELHDRIAHLVRAAELVDEALACGCDHLEGCERAGHRGDDDVGPPREPLTDPTRNLLPAGRRPV